MSLSVSSRMQIEWECTSLCYRFMHCIDRGDIDSFANLLVEDCEISSELGAWRGREHIRALFGARDRTGTRLRHVITNLHFVDVQEDRAEAIGYNTSYFYTGRKDEGPFGLAKLFELHDTYVRTEEGWRVKSRRSTLILGPEDWIDQTLERTGRKAG